MYEIGMANGWLFDVNDPDIDPNATAQFSSKNNPHYAPLDGLKTYPEIIEAMEEQNGPLNTAVLRWLSVVNSITKWNKTVGSPVTHVRNLLGNTFFALRNGHLGGQKAPKAVLETLRSLSGKESEFMKKLIELGVINTSVDLEEVRQ